MDGLMGRSDHQGAVPVGLELSGIPAQEPGGSGKTLFLAWNWD